MDKAFLEAWLQLQCQIVPDLRRACVRVLTDTGAPLQATWPPGETPPESIEDLLGLALRSGQRVTANAQAQQVAGSDTVATLGGAHLQLAQPLKLSDATGAAIALELPAKMQHQQAAVASLLDWGNAWLNFSREMAAAGEAAPAGVPDLIRTLGGQPRFQSAVMAAIGWLAHRFDCQRVSLGVRRGGRYRLTACSDQAAVAERSDLARRLEDAMHQAATDAPAEDAAAPVLTGAADGEIYSGLLEIDGQYFAALAFEPGPDQALSGQQQREIAAFVPLLGGLLGLRWQREQSLVDRWRQSLRDRSDWLRPALLSAALIVVALGLYADTAYRVGGEAVLEGEVQQALVAPFDGYIGSALVRAGERVAAGQLLAELDDKELRLQRRLREGDKVELEKAYRKALAGMDHSEARILQAQIARSEAEIELIERQLERTHLLAPFDGLVVSGDLSRSLGKPVERGEVLFEVAPLDGYRVAIEVRDWSIAEIEAGQRGALVLAAMPTERLPLEVINVTHFSSGEGETEHFRVEARLSEMPPEASGQLRPGMRGVAKLDLGLRPRLWVWTHELIDWLRLRLWAWLP